MSISNRQISKLFKMGAYLLELHGENEFKVRTYERASQDIRSMSDPLADMSETELAELEGIGATTAKNIRQIIKTGTFDELDKLMQLTPPGLVELLSIKGLGAKKVRSIWKDLGITSPEEVLDACKDNRISGLRGFGKKTQANIENMIRYFFESKDKFLYAEAEYDAIPLLDFFENSDKVARVSLTGEMRRRLPVVGKIELLVELKKEASIDEVIADAGDYLIIQNGKLLSGQIEVPVEITVSKHDSWATELITTTGSKEHLQLLGLDETTGDTEEKIYQKAGFPYIIPEMREGRDELIIAEKTSIDDIIRYEDLKGCLHNHSTWSDGSNTIEQMARECVEQGLQYFGLCDHSQAAFYAGGLKPNAVYAQWKEIDKLNQKLAPFRIFKGIEADILSTGKLDYDEELLKEFDFVVGSVHSQLKMNQQDATRRLLRAIESPYLTILGHMTGRLLLMRAGFPVDYEKIIDACAANGVIIEINANPRRLDMDWKWYSYAIEKGVMLSINPDGHHTAEIRNMYYGVCVARKGGVPKNMVLNTYPLEKIERYFIERKRRFN